MKFEENIPLAPLTTFGIGGPAAYFVCVESVEELTEALSFAKEKGLKMLVLGGGSNVLMPDEGFKGLVIKIEINRIEVIKEGEKVLYVAGAGEHWDSVVKKAVDEGVWGLENLSGIPGTVGGAVSGNIGAYGQVLSQTLVWAEVLDTLSGDLKTFTNQECEFEYRGSFFKHDGGRHIIVRACFLLSNEPDPNLSYTDPNKAYKDIKKMLADNPHPSLSDIREGILAIRASKFPDLALEGTAGSFFKNPIVPEAEAEELAARYEGLPLFPMSEAPGEVKVPVAWLMDHVLHMHGTKVGGARLFEKQILVIAVEKNCKATDVRELAERVQKEIKEKTGIQLESEVRIV